MIRQTGNLGKPQRNSGANPRLVFSALLAAGTTTRYRPDQTIVSQGDDCADVRYVEEGLVKLTLVSPRGKNAVLGILGKGDFFGERCISGEAMHLTSAVAIVECSAVKISRRSMSRALEQHPAVAKEFIRYLLTHNHRIEENLVDHFFHSSEKRLVRILLRLAQYGKGDAGKSVLPRVSQDTLAEMVGTTRSRVNYFMNQFRKAGLIRYNGDLEVRDSLASVLQD
ncbi:MAG: Crp/Fnr family transcriptional regulator [Candidatus Acidiferrales bacterium]